LARSSSFVIIRYRTISNFLKGVHSILSGL